MLTVIPSSGASGYQISRSVRLRSSASAYFNRTPASTTNQKTWTFSCWMKRGILGTNGMSLISAGTAANNGTSFYFSSDQLIINNIIGGGSQGAASTPAVLRDPSAWYHIVLAMDTTQTSFANGWARIYINGVQQTLTQAAAPTQNSNTFMNLSTNAMWIARDIINANYFDGYLTEINFIDGQALTPSSFGSTNATTGVWQPAKYTGTYGTNGFYLNFSDNSAATAAAIGKDYSGNGNNWTPNNISVTAGTTYDSMIDVPTPYADGSTNRGNYAVLNPLTNPHTTLTDGNLTSAGGDTWSNSTVGVSSGKWYAEFTVTTMAVVEWIGVGQNIPISGYNGQLSTDYSYANNGQKYNNNTGAAYGASYTSGDIIGVAFDADSGSLTFYKNNASQGVAYSSMSAGTYYFQVYGRSTSGTSSIAVNFGQRPFSYTPPSGFKALNTYNLPASTITNGGKYMAALLWTGNGAASQNITSGNFKPDFAWLKCRSTVDSNNLVNSVTGGNQVLQSNNTNAEVTAGMVDAWLANGITANLNENVSGRTYVGWLWQAGQGSTSSNTSGSITSTVSVNATAGFSIVTYTGTGANATVGHGLGVAPKMVIVKSRSTTFDWNVYHSSLTSAAYVIYLDATNAQASSPTTWNSTAPTSTVFSIGSATQTNTNAATYVAYCWSEIAGFSKFGSYTGNGSTDGPFVYCGFRPRYVMIKRTDVANWWIIWDSARNTYNVQSNYLLADSANYENNSGASPFDYMDALANGFKLRSNGLSVNTTSGTYIFAAFAENPFANALAR